MPFASTQLAARIEQAECSLLRECLAATRARRPRARAQVCEIAGGLAAFADVGSPLNKVSGLGFEGPIDVGELEAVEAESLRRGIDVQVELSALADPSVGPLLSRRGYVLVGFENVLARALPAAPGSRAAAEVEVGRCREADEDTWMHVVVTGFASPDVQGLPSHESFPRDVLESVMRDMTSAPSFARYLAWREGEPAGGAGMRVSEGVAQMCGAATLPAHRRRGVQSALLAARLLDAARAGCDVAVVTAQPGSKSHENVQKLGFELLYTRAILVRSAH